MLRIQDETKFDRVICGGNGKNCTVKTRIGNRVVTIRFEKIRDKWVSAGRYATAIPEKIN